MTAPVPRPTALHARPVFSTTALAAQGRLSLTYMGISLVGLLGATALLVSSPELLGLTHVHPHVVGLTHAWVLGFFVTVACGAVYQLAPVALGTTLANERWAWWHLGLHVVGVPGMVYSFWISDYKLLGHFGTFVGLGIGLFCANVWRTVRRSRRTGLVAWSLNLAAGWLAFTVLAGLLLAANRFWYFIPLDPIAMLRAHAHAGLIGFFLTLIQGVGFQLVPMFTLAEVRDWTLGIRGLVISQVGLVGLVPSLVCHLGTAATVCGALVVVGMIISGLALHRVLGTRKKRAFEPGTGAFLAGCVGLIVAGVAGVVLVAPLFPWGSATGGFSASVYAVLLFFGGLLPCIAGMMCKIIPFLTWMRAYGPRVGRAPTPPASALAHPQLERWGLRLQFVAAVPLAIGAWLENGVWLQFGAWTLAVSVLLFVAACVAVLRHLWRPDTGPIKTSPPRP